MDKWQGSFAQTQLEKFGWAKGEGLGKEKHGNAKHISVSVKNDKKGVGVNQGNWEFAWWDHLYNKSANAVTVEKEEGEVKLATKNKSKDRRSTTGIISTQRPTGKSVEEKTKSTMGSMADQKNMMDSVEELHGSIAQKLASASLYGTFVKSTPKESADDDELKDYSLKVTDAELFAACEGRTARKGGRGLVDQTGKFKRVMKEYVRPEEVENNTKKRKHSEEESKDKKSKKQKKDKKDKKDKKEKKEKKKDKKEKKKDKKEKKEKKKDKKKEKKEKR